MLVAAAVVCLRGVTTMKSKLGAAFPTALRPRDRRTELARQRTYIRLHGRVDRLEDAISHFYNVINELRRRVSTLEKKLKPLNGGGGERRSPEL
jgi:Arc/MetJ family transcription regulator